MRTLDKWKVCPFWRRSIVGDSWERAAIRLILVLLTLLSAITPAYAESKKTPINYEITPVVSKIKFRVKASIPIEGTFEKWDAKLAFASTDPSSGSLLVKIHADSVNTGSKMKDDKLKSEDCFNVKKHPHIFFRSTKIIQTGKHTFEVLGTVTIRDITKTETLTFAADKEADGRGEITGTLWFDRRDFGLGGSIPFVKIADYVELTIDFKAKRISGPPLLFK